MEITNIRKPRGLNLLFKINLFISRPQDFYVKLNKSSLSFYNKPESSHIPVHLQITNTKLQNIESSDLASVLWSVKTCR